MTKSNRKSRRNVNVENVTEAVLESIGLSIVNDDDTVTEVVESDVIDSTEEFTSMTETPAPAEVEVDLTTDELQVEPEVVTDEVTEESTDEVADEKVPYVTPFEFNQTKYGITMGSPRWLNGLCHQVWKLADSLTEIDAETGAVTIPALRTVQVLGTAQGLNLGNINIEYGRWKKWNSDTFRGATVRPHTDENATDQAA